MLNVTQPMNVLIPKWLILDISGSLSLCPLLMHSRQVLAPSILCPSFLINNERRNTHLMVQESFMITWKYIQPTVTVLSQICYHWLWRASKQVLIIIMIDIADNNDVIILQFFKWLHLLVWHDKEEYYKDRHSHKLFIWF